MIDYSCHLNSNLKIVMLKNVRLIFNMYLQGESVLGIVSELERLGIMTPIGKEKWAKQTIDVMLSNENIPGMSGCWMMENTIYYYLSEENNPAITSKVIFEAVQIEKQHRSNVIKS